MPKKPVGLGGAIHILRVIAGYTQDNLSKKVSLDPSYVSLIESGKRDPSLKAMKALAVSLEIDLASLIWLGDLSRVEVRNALLTK